MFVFSFPVWVLIRVPTYKTHGLPDGVARVNAGRFGVPLFTFTDDHLADQFVLNYGDPDFGKAEQNETQYRQILNEAKARGTTHVGIDCAANGGGRYHPIDDIINAIP